jgi:chromosome segregation ATPase
MSRNGPAQPKRAGRLLDVERFERVVAPGATTLLRLSGRLHSRAHSDGAAPILVMGAADGRAHRFLPLPGPVPAIAGDRLLAAFAVPAALLDGGEAIISVELAPGFAVALGAPEERALRATDRVRELEAEVAALRERADEADELLAELDRLHEARLLDAAAHESTADAFERAQAEHSEVEGRLSAAHAELAEAELLRERLSDERGMLAARVDELESELLTARAGADELLADAEAARVDAEARLAGAEERITALMTSVLALEARVVELEAERAGAQARLAALETERRRAQAEAAEHQAAQADAQAWIERLQNARDELAGRLTELEGELVSARADGDRREAAALRLLDDAQTRIAELEAARAEARDEFGREAAEREAAERRAGELQAERDAVAVELRQAGERAQSLADQLAGHLATERELRAEHATAAGALRDLEVEVEDARRAASRERAARTDAVTRAAALEERLDAAESSRRDALGSAAAVREQAEAAEERVDSLTGQLDELTAQLQAGQTRLEAELAERARVEATAGETTAALRDSRRRIEELTVDLRFAEEAAAAASAAIPMTEAEARTARHAAARAEVALGQADDERIDLERHLAAAWEYAVAVEAQLGGEAAARRELEERVQALLAHQEALALRVEELIAARQTAESTRDVLAQRLAQSA